MFLVVTPERSQGTNENRVYLVVLTLFSKGVKTTPKLPKRIQKLPRSRNMHFEGVPILRDSQHLLTELHASIRVIFIQFVYQLNFIGMVFVHPRDSQRYHRFASSPAGNAMPRMHQRMPTIIL
ncbi:hypothetical protein NQ318_016021 [Aromia moschata]|uniref:Uncharacterized protein n=1 Tax=Aromia moschata TaxID=1265417 RepID=A0AAV8XM06_9CUCU|nr:hypothetical protein NQ318_016021 [Aromia moschata]